MAKEQLALGDISDIFREEWPPNFESLPWETQEIILKNTSRSCFRDGLNFLKRNQSFPNERINHLTGLFWCLLTNNIIGFKISSDVNHLGFWVWENSGFETGAVFVPIDFAQGCQDNPTLQLQTIVAAASGAQDFYHQECSSLKVMRKRGMAYEAEFLLTRKILPPTFVPDEYQRGILHRYPKGFASLTPELQYQPEPIPPIFLIPPEFLKFDLVS